MVRFARNKNRHPNAPDTLRVSLTVLLLLRTTSLLSTFVYAATDGDGDRIIRCPIGFGRDDSTTIRIVPPHQIDDGYCDCPTTGEDEPNTNACAGIEYWPGLIWTSSKDDDDFGEDSNLGDEKDEEGASKK